MYQETVLSVLSDRTLTTLSVVPGNKYSAVQESNKKWTGQSGLAAFESTKNRKLLTVLKETIMLTCFICYIFIYNKYPDNNCSKTFPLSLNI